MKHPVKSYPYAKIANTKKWYSTGRITGSLRLSSVFSGACPILGAT